MNKWFIDLYHNLDWINTINQDKSLPAPNVTANFNFSSSPKFDGYWKLYGTEFEPCLVRFILPHIITFEECNEFIDTKLSKLINHLELSISLLLNQSFYFRPIPGGPVSMKYISFGQGDENDLPVSISEQFEYPKFDYNNLATLVTAYFKSLEHYADLLHSGMNTSLKIEYRWLEFYKIFEMHFADSGELKIYNKRWTDFLNLFSTDLTPYLRPKQTLHGFIAEVRNGTAHYVIAGGKLDVTKERVENIRLIIDTFPIITKMVVTIINEHPENKSLKVTTNF